MKKLLITLMIVAIASFLFVGCFPPPTNQTPILTSSPITTATVGVLYTYDVNATDPDGDTLTYSLAVKPSGMTINSATGLIKWTPVTAQVGDNSVTVKVSDKFLSITQSFKIKVGTLPPVNHAPNINSIPITTATVGVTYVYDVNATDSDNDVLTYSLTAYPSGMTISSTTGLIMWVPTAKGNYAVVVNVSDGALSDTQGFTITVSELPVINQAPVITSTPSLTATVGVKYTYTIEATDPDGDAITHSLVSGPTGMTFDGIATVSWTPVLDQVGTHDVTVKASDGKKDATQSFTITVSKVPELVTIRWLKNAVRFHPDGTYWGSWINDRPYGPVTLILSGVEYHFADAKEYYNIHVAPNTKGSIVIDGTGQFIGDTTYTSLASFLPIRDHFEGDVEIIIYETVFDDLDGTMVGTYTQWGYALAESDDVEAMSALDTNYPKAVLAPEQGSGWWFIGYTEYIAHGWDPDAVLNVP